MWAALGLIFSFTSLFAISSGFLTFLFPLIFSTSFVSGKEIFRNGWFYIKHSNGSEEIYERVANCNWPHCNGVVRLQVSPTKEIHNHDMVGRCSNEKSHTFSYQKNQLGYYCKMDFSELTKELNE